MSSKTCSTCGIEKTIIEFSVVKYRLTGSGVRGSCKECEKKRKQAQYTENREYYRNRKLKRLFGITQADYLNMLEAQNGRCAICGTDVPGGNGAFHVDHCHTANNVRGLLCHKCNVGLGLFNDNISSLSSAILYLSNHS